MKNYNKHGKSWIGHKTTYPFDIIQKANLDHKIESSSLTDAATWFHLTSHKTKTNLSLNLNIL